MLEKFAKWFRGSGRQDHKTTDEKLRQSGAHRQPPGPGRDRRRGADRRHKSDVVDVDPQVAGKFNGDSIPDGALIRNRYKREDTGTHETLQILDDSLVDTGEETGIDPYNTGNFDRSRNWDKRFRN